MNHFDPIHSTNLPSSNPPSSKRHPARVWGRFLAGVLLGALVAGSAVVYSQATKATLMGFSGSGWFARHHGARNIETALERAEFAIDWILSRVQASAEQRAKAKSVVENAIRELYPAKEQHRQNREALMQALLQPSVDRAALERARQSELQLAETVSTRLVNALAEISEILTPEQRAALAERVSRFHH
jgi:periplasmic protein CpxP/Spy